MLSWILVLRAPIVPWRSNVILPGSQGREGRIVPWRSNVLLPGSQGREGRVSMDLKGAGLCSQSSFGSEYQEDIWIR